jgi:hypothetical protein
LNVRRARVDRAADGIPQVLVELSVSYRVEIDEGAWAFLYAAPVGSPAFGPVPYMHRSSGSVNPVTPISHHFLDATHVTHGVITAGVFDERIVAEASWLNGREPDAIRWTTEIPRLDSWSVRFTWLAGRDWAVQASHGLFREPERLHPGIDARKSSVSVTHHRSWGSTVTWSTTAAWGLAVHPRTTMSIAEARARLSVPLLQHYLGVAELPPDADNTLLLLFERRAPSATLLETSVRWSRTTAYARFERAQKSELFPPSDLRHSDLFQVVKIDGGLAQEAPVGPLRVSIGASASLHVLPRVLHTEYGSNPWSCLVFTTVRF